jgi:lysyl-tRNA synthetase class 1
MHWSEELARQVIERNPDKEEYVCAAGISPSGSVHIGNFRDVATSYFVVRALRKLGKRARLLFSWDEYDRMRKVPANVAAAAPGFEKYIGAPYISVPNPFGDGAPNYAAYFEREFERAMELFGIEMDYRYQASMYLGGKYTDRIIHALRHRFEIFDVLDSFRTQDAEKGERENYYPVSIFCPACGRDTTRITSLSEDCTKATYTCDCGHAAEFDFLSDYNCKLAWKVDWAMRWAYEGVDFEPGGKDHASPSGSYAVSSIISEQIFGYRPPIFVGYEFIGLKGLTGKMSGSSGLNLTPQTLLNIYQPEVILWLYSKTEPQKAFNFCFDEGILRQYLEFDKMYDEVAGGTADEYTNAIMYNTTVKGRTIHTVPMSLLVQLGSIVDFNVPLLETVFEKIGMPYRHKQFADRLDRARYWLEQCAPEQVYHLRDTRNWEVYDTLGEYERREIELLYNYIKQGGYTLNELNTELYAIPKRVFGTDLPQNELKKIQGRFFRNVYRLLLDRERGPRLYLFLYAIDPARYLYLLDFSTPKTEAEQAAELPPESEDKPEPECAGPQYGEPDPVEPIKEQVVIDDFSKLDLRVCKIIACDEVRKSHSCYKLTLDDGIGKRTIMSSIKNYYRPEELVGRKIIVVANLKPARISNVTSEGMLLAATNSACGCMVVFVEDAVPPGTAVK